MTDLLPCPFCGCKPKKYEVDGWYYIGCLSKRCSVVVRVNDDEDGVKAWNTRIPTPPKGESDE